MFAVLRLLMLRNQSDAVDRLFPTSNSSSKPGSNQRRFLAIQNPLRINTFFLHLATAKSLTNNPYLRFLTDSRAIIWR